jgi:uncharacterized membrane protein
MGETAWAVRLVDLVLLVAVAEAVLLLAYQRRTGKGPRFVDIGANLLAGLCLMLALRAAVAGLPWGWIAAALLGAGLAHALDLRRRWNG